MLELTMLENDKNKDNYMKYSYIKTVGIYLEFLRKKRLWYKCLEEIAM
jgi:hypothetical protein